MTRAVLGIIGGSGIYDLPGLEDVRDGDDQEPVGRAVRAADARRHRRACRSCSCRGTARAIVLSPSDINYRANIDVLKRAGVTDLVSLSACGSFQEDLPPGTFVLVDQFVDRTHKRESSFFGKGCVAHVSMAHPVSPRLRVHLAAAAEAEGIAAVQRRHLCLHGGSAVLQPRREPDLQGAGLFGDRHDQHARGQSSPARPRSATPAWRWSPISIAGIPITTRSPCRTSSAC